MGEDSQGRGVALLHRLQFEEEQSILRHHTYATLLARLFGFESARFEFDRQIESHNHRAATLMAILFSALGIQKDRFRFYQLWSMGGVVRRSQDGEIVSFWEHGPSGRIVRGVECRNEELNLFGFVTVSDYVVVTPLHLVAWDR